MAKEAHREHCYPSYSEGAISSQINKKFIYPEIPICKKIFTKYSNSSVLEGMGRVPKGAAWEGLEKSATHLK